MPATPTTPARSRCSPHRRPPSTRPAPGPPHGAAPTTTGPPTREPHVVLQTPTELEQVVACKTSYQPTINYLRDTPLVPEIGPRVKHWLVAQSGDQIVAAAVAAHSIVARVIWSGGTVAA